MPSDVELDSLLLRRIVDVLPRAIVVTDRWGTIRLWNATAERLYGWPAASVLGRPIFEILGPDDAAADGPAILEALLAGRTHHAERHLVHRDGTAVHVVTVTTALLGDDGEIELIVGATDDLAELALLQRETEALTDHLRLALDAGGFGTWRWDLASGVTEWDPEMERVFGVEPGGFDGTFEAWTSLLHPDDRDEVLRGVEEAVANKSHYRVEHRVIAPDGSVRWVEGAGRVTLDAAGEVTGTIGCCHDITERAAAESQRQHLAAMTEESLARERVQRERLELVQAVNDALEDANDLAELMTRVTQAVVPSFSDWCGISVLESESATVPLTEISHRDPAMVAYARELQDRFPFDPAASGGVAAVIRTGRAEFHPHIDEAVIAASDASPELRQIIRDLGLQSSITVALRKRGRSLGAIQFVMAPGRRSYAEEDLAVAEAIGARIAASLDNRRLRVQRDRTARTDAALANLGRRLAAAASEKEVLAVIGEDAPVVLRADHVDIGLAHDAESITISGDVERIVPLDSAGPVAAALAQAETILHHPDVATPGSEVFADPLGALVASPLYDDVHEPMGVLVLRWEEPTSLDEVDLNAIETLSRLCGQAIVRSQLAGHTEDLARLASSMAAARSTTDVARLLQAHGRSDLRATVANLRLLDSESAALLPVIPSGLPAEIDRRYERIPVTSDLPVTDAVRDDEPIWIPDLDHYRARYPEAAAQAARGGIGAAAVVPLCDSDGTPMGVVSLGWPTAMRFDHRLRATLSTLADLAAQTLERVRLFEAEHAVISSMQRRLLAPLPEVAGLDMVPFYEPAAAALGMGGDWYEAITLADGSAVVIIGDVVGHGVNAVAAMAQIQHLLTGLLRAGAPLGEVLATANTMITGPEPTYATALLLHLDPVGGRIGHSSAGHPYPLVREPDGTVHVLDGNQHPMFGLPLQASELVYSPLVDGAMVLAYTDGLVERRGETIDRGIERLAASFGRSRAPDLDDDLHRLVEEARGSDPEHRATSDDVAAILIRVGERPPSKTPGRPS
ncbi:SpoIIE family protein phosphatase [Aquihabitans sp. McL0605]|uniref:SpoIIE family protein phosphatase n=1 Tax=Aquihabitans sp. McL0605 TaxID=3415671 RepID=UPI003CF31ADB